MRRTRAIAAALLALAALAAVVLATSGPPPPTPTPPGSFAFAVLGDAPYYPWEEVQYRLVLREMDANDLRFVVHVGDIFWHPCTDEFYRSRLGWFDELRHPVVLTPGDNEWADCWEPGSGSFAPLERLARLREIFYRDPERSLGRRPMPLASQRSHDPHAEFVENARWTHEGFVFATLHLVGSWNGRKPFPARTSDDDAAADRRTAAAVAWLREAFAEATANRARGVVLAFHANPGFEEPVADRYRRTYEPFLETLEEEVARFGGPVLMVQGDDHEYIVDRPLVRRATGQRLRNLTRMQVPGSPVVGWVRVVVTPDAASPFAFEEHVVPRWKYW
jgi:hypothetical protein